MVNSRRGRPPGPARGRQRLLDAVVSHIQRGDIAETSTRLLAREAGVSHTLVNYYFGDRQALIAAGYALTVAPHQVIDASRDAAGTLDAGRVLVALVAVWDHPSHGPALREFARRAVGGEDRAALVEYVQHAIVEVLVADLGIARARRVALTVLGTIMGRYLLELPTLTTMPRPELIRLMRDSAGV